MGVVVLVSGAVGGVGASTLAYALAQCAGGVLVDMQADGVPLDVLVGAEAVPGTRWSQVRVSTGEIAPDAILSALPVINGVTLLSADFASTGDAAALVHVIEALRKTNAFVVVDLPLRHGVRDVLHADAEILLTPPTVPALIVAAATSANELRLVIADRGPADIDHRAISRYLNHDLIGAVRWQRGVAMAMSSGSPIPHSTDVMRIARLICDEVNNA